MRTNHIGDNEINCLPFLKWAGGKRWLANKIVDSVPRTFGRFIEPFLGSGAVFFALNPKRAVLSDKNEWLIETYEAIKSDWQRVQSHLRVHQRNHSRPYYYQIRSSKPRSIFSSAAKFIYLNRTSWNGLYRENLKGEFNVPIGTKATVLLDTDDFELIACRLHKAKLICADFEAVIDKAEKSDVVYVDPPYTVAHGNNGFIKYNQHLFTWADQVRLRDAILRANARGVRTVVSNAAHGEVARLYKGSFVIHKLERQSVIAGDARYRKSCNEYLILNK